MLKHFRPALVLLVAFTLLVGGIYPLAVTGIAQSLFKSQSAGSPVVRDGVVVGSSLIGQTFTRPDYFWGRPSAAGAGYDASASSGSNLGPSSAVLAARMEETAIAYGAPAGAIPSDLLTTSASGLDPHISLAGAQFQAPRVAAARNLSTEDVTRLIEEHTLIPSLGFIGETRVNVLELNLALDRLKQTEP